MQLFVEDRFGKKIILDVTAPTRKQLSYKIGTEFYVGDQYYHINQVVAESSSNDTAGGAILGGLIGLLGGGVGVAVGGFLGGLIGNARDTEENKKINLFNQSRV